METQITTTEATPVPAWSQMDSLHGQLEKLCALLAHICGAGFESFDVMTDSNKAWYLLHVSDFAELCKHDAGRITRLLCDEVQAEKLARERHKAVLQTVRTEKAAKTAREAS